MNKFIFYTVNIVYRKLRRIKNDRKIKVLLKQSPLKVIVGGGGIDHPGWIVTEIENVNILIEENWRRYFSENSIDVIMAEHVWEHLTIEEAIKAAKNCYQFLKSGGYLRMAVPDGYHPDPEYINNVKPFGIGPGCDDHKILYNYRTLSSVFTSVGFKVELLEYWDEDGEFHFLPWDRKDGFIERSKAHDPRNRDGSLRYTSIILDARKK